MRLGELAAASRVAQPTMSKMVQNLAADEWVRRIADVEDSRSWLIAPSPKGQRALAEWQEKVAAAAAPLFGDLSADQWSTLSAAADILRTRLITSRAAA